VAYYIYICRPALGPISQLPVQVCGFHLPTHRGTRRLASAIDSCSGLKLTNSKVLLSHFSLRCSVSPSRCCACCWSSWLLVAGLCGAALAEREAEREGGAGERESGRAKASTQHTNPWIPHYSFAWACPVAVPPSASPAPIARIQSKPRGEWPPSRTPSRRGSG
jgi:hypothetical protein